MYFTAPTASNKLDNGLVVPEGGGGIGIKCSLAALYRSHSSQADLSRGK